MKQVTQAGMDILDERIAACRAALASEASERPVLALCNWSLPCEECPIGGNHGDCGDVPEYMEARSNPTYATIGALLDWLLALRAECEVDDGSMLFRDVPGGARVQWKTHKARKLSHGKSQRSLGFTNDGVRYKPDRGDFVILDDFDGLWLVKGDERVKVIGEGK